ncbi:MAG: hypothetical protein CVU42_04035 [Chloroflexi bacterium HGW-Chloroflexi-4]|jgi:uncharacterized membrane protein YkoI|nr:MAG: hypothetical protein CVU42_04035 [Chloroflexi bacterium HGW-Chloroflexi-4]
MKNKASVAISIFITVFVITIGIGVITKVSADNNPQSNSSPTVDATAFAEREAAYQQIIAQANQQIEFANQQIATLANEITPQSNQEPTLEATSPYLFSPEQASAIAQQIAGVAPKTLPELVSFSGTPAYEVIYGNGKVYVDANTGAVLFNGLQKAVTKITSEQALYIAVNYLKTSQPVSMNTSTFNGASVYVIQFADGQSVFVDMTGKVVAVQMASPAQTSSSSDDDDHPELSDDSHEEDDD